MLADPDVTAGNDNMTDYYFFDIVGGTLGLGYSTSAATQPAMVVPASGDDLKAVFATSADLVEGKRLAGKSSTAMGEAKGLEDLHLITYDIPQRKYADRGAIFW